MRIHHIAIIASDYARSKDFYTRILGFKIIRETHREERQSYKLDLQVGDAQIELFSFPNPAPRPSRPEARGARHIALHRARFRRRARGACTPPASSSKKSASIPPPASATSSSPTRDDLPLEIVRGLTAILDPALSTLPQSYEPQLPGRTYSA